MAEEIQEVQEPQEEEVSPQASAEPSVEDLKQQLVQARDEAVQWQDRCLRTAAEFANYRKRVEREREQQLLRLKMEVLRKVLPIADDFDLALENIPKEYENLPWVDGVKMIAQKIKTLLEESGVTPIPAVGEPFDPLYHDALMHEESDEYPEGIVSGEIRKGYMLGDQVLRPTLVRVSAGLRNKENNK